MRSSLCIIGTLIDVEFSLVGIEGNDHPFDKCHQIPSKAMKCPTRLKWVKSASEESKKDGEKKG